MIINHRYVYRTHVMQMFNIKHEKLGVLMVMTLVAET